jgi:hypothetical protein
VVAVVQAYTEYLRRNYRRETFTNVGDLVGDAVRPEHIAFDATDAAVRLFSAVAGEARGVEVAGDFHIGRVAQLRATAMHSIS